MTASAPGAALELEVRTDLAELPRVLAAVDGLVAAGVVAEKTAFALKVALDEVLVNVIRHAHGGDREHFVRVRLEAAAAGVRLEVSDGGPPFDPLAVPPPDTAAPLAERAVGGLGIHLVRQLMDEVRYERTGDRNVLVMTKWSER